jgi:hypothetical protein
VDLMNQLPVRVGDKVRHAGARGELVFVFRGWDTRTRLLRQAEVAPGAHSNILSLLDFLYASASAYVLAVQLEVFVATFPAVLSPWTVAMGNWSSNFADADGDHSSR